jgi:hypothetical protein
MVDFLEVPNEYSGDLTGVVLNLGKSLARAMYGPRSSSNQRHGYPGRLLQLKSHPGNVPSGHRFSLSHFRPFE